MPRVHPIKCVLGVLMLLLCLSRSVSSQERNYTDNTDGLRQLLQSMLTAAKERDYSRLSALIKETEIPNYQVWFTATFGQDKGESWAGPYGKNLIQNQKEFQEFIKQLAQEVGEISVQKLDATKMYDTLTVPLDIFLADWKKLAGSKGQAVDHIGYFMFIDGKFRWDSTVEFIRVQPKGMDFTEFKIIKKIAPTYPPEAMAEGVQGTVKLHVTIQTDGSVKVLEVISGDPLLSPAALSAVRQWRYEPGRVKGKPVNVDTTIEVDFTLNK
jgi:TonB family protein